MPRSFLVKLKKSSSTPIFWEEAGSSVSSAPPNMWEPIRVEIEPSQIFQPIKLDLTSLDPEVVTGKAQLKPKARFFSPFTFNSVQLNSDHRDIGVGKPMYREPPCTYDSGNTSPMSLDGALVPSPTRSDDGYPSASIFIPGGGFLGLENAKSSSIPTVNSGSGSAVIKARCLTCPPGARCAPNTFDGERCLYAALTDKIRTILKDFKAITSECMRRDSYREFLRRCLEQAPFADVCFLVHGESFHVHRVVMVARSEYFAHMFMSKWRDRPIIELKHKLVKPWAFKAILQYLYTDRMYIDMDYIDDCIRLARQCKLEYLKTQLEIRLKSIEVFGMSKTRTQSITVVSIEPESQSTDLQDSFGHVAEFSIPAALRTQQFPRPFPFEISLDMLDVFFEDPPLYADVCFVVEGIRFYGHKVFFCGRSDYFRALLDGHFSKSVSPRKLVPSESVPEVCLNDVTPEVFATVVAFIYQDQAVLTEETVFSVLYFADVYLLNGLKRHCERVMSTLLDEENVLHVLRTARLFDLARLEADCCEHLAKNLDKIIDEKEFHTIIFEDAASVRNRQETDSVPIVDDIRFHLYKGILPNNTTDGEQLVDCENKLRSLEDLLIRLGIEC